MNFTSLHYFQVTAQELNITKAATRLYISQQALSEHIRKLEKELDLQLFDRTRAMTLTYAGRQLLEYVSGILDMEKQIHQTAWDINNNKRGEVRVGMSHTCGRAILPHILPLYKKSHPLVDIKLTESSSEQLETMLERGDLDIIIGFAPLGKDKFTTIDLVEERLFLAVPKVLLKHYFGACYDAIKSECQRKLDITLFRPLPFIMLQKGNRTRALVDRYMNRSDFKPNIILETDNIETAFALAEKGMGVTVYPELYYWCLHYGSAQAEEPLELFTMVDESETEHLQIGWIKERYQSKAIKDLITLCCSVLEKMSGFHMEMRL